MKLKDFLKEEDITQEEFAKKIGSKQTTVARWIQGATPRVEMMSKILLATQGKVTANDFYYEDK